MKYLKLSIPVLVFALMPLLAFAEDATFKPLTDLPVFESVKTGGGLAGFFNQLYVLSVGAAAVIAVAQIMIAGFKWSTAGGNHSAIEQSRDLIRNSILGLILVLSPTIVFSIINPDILALRVNTSGLQSDDVNAYNAPQPTNPVELENTCSNDTIRTSLQSNLSSWRTTHPTGEWKVTWTSPPENGWGQAGVGCCKVVKDTNGSSCTSGALTQNFTPAGTLNLKYSCTCNGGAVTGETGYKVDTLSIRVKGTPYAFIVGPNVTTQSHPTKEACESVTTYTQDVILKNLKDGVFVCVEKNNDFCQKNVDEVKNLSTLPANTLQMSSRSCVLK